MKISLNGELLETRDAERLDLFLKKNEYPFERIVVEHNGNIIKSAQWSSIVLKDGDRLEILAFVGGG